MWRMLFVAVRCTGKIVLNVASSRIASLLLLGGKAAHSRFYIPILIMNNQLAIYLKEVIMLDF